MMPERAGKEGVAVNFSRWYGVFELGAIYTTPVGDESASAVYNAAATKVKVILNCPSINHPAGSSWTGDYTYNQRMGDNRAYVSPFSGTPYFRKAASRRTVLVAMDCSEITDNNTDHFSKVADLVPFDGGPTHRAGRPHNMGKTANMLFIDGQIFNDDPNKLGPTASSTDDWIVDRSKQELAMPFK